MVALDRRRAQISRRWVLLTESGRVLLATILAAMSLTAMVAPAESVKVGLSLHIRFPAPFTHLTTRACLQTRSLSNTSKLIAHLLDGYMSSAPPEGNGPLEVQVQFVLLNIASVSTADQQMKLHGW
jgi:hypothetical protein